jgi:hypothetical protein
LPALAPDRRKALLTALRTGLSREAACAKLGLRDKEIEATGKRFAEQVAEAESAGDALIEATLLERGLAGDTQALKMALERRPRLADAELGTGLESLTAVERDAVRRMVETALAGKAAATVTDLNPVERQQRLLAIQQALRGDGVSVQPVVKLVPPVEAPQGTAAAAAHPDTGQAVVAAPEPPVAPRVSAEEALAKGPVRDRHNHLVYADLPGRSQPGPDRSSERRGPVIAPSEFDWRH